MLFVSLTQDSPIWYPLEDRGPCTLWCREVTVASGAKRLEYKVTRGEIAVAHYLDLGNYRQPIFKYRRQPPSLTCRPHTGQSKRRAWSFWYAKERTEVNKQNLDVALPTL